MVMNPMAQSESSHLKQIPGTFGMAMIWNLATFSIILINYPWV